MSHRALGAVLFTSVLLLVAAASLAAAPLRLSLFTQRLRACDGPPQHDAVGGRPRVMCTNDKADVPFLFEAIGAEADLDEVTLMMGIDREHPVDWLVASNEMTLNISGKRLGDIFKGDFASKLLKRPVTAKVGTLQYKLEFHATLSMVAFSARNLASRSYR